ncbi:MAG: hypothetical protein PHV06_06380 [bacterium]|nr:hypothetical protein [bacterium]
MKKLITLLGFLILSILTFSNEMNFPVPRKEFFSIKVHPTKKYFISNHEDVFLTWRISLIESYNFEYNDCFNMFPIDSSYRYSKYDIFKNGNNSPIEFKEQNGGSKYKIFIVLNKMNKSFEGISDLLEYNIYEEVNGKRIYYEGDYIVNIEHPLGKNVNGYHEMFDKIIVENIRFKIINSNECLSSKLIFEPHKWNSQWRESDPEGYVNCYIGNLESGTVEDIIQDEIWFNGNLKPESVEIKNHHAGFEGKVMHLKFKMKDVIKLINLSDPYGIPNNVNVQAKLQNGKILNAETNVEIIYPEK